MPANKHALIRYRIIDNKIRNKYQPYPSKEDLREACEEALYGSSGQNISMSTIEKDLRAMKEDGELAYYAPIKFSKLEKGYYYEDESFSIDEMPLNEDDLEALKFAATTLLQFKGVSLFQQFENAIDKICNRIDLNRHNQDTSLQSYIQFDAEANFKGKDYLQPLIEAIKNQQKIKIKYQSFVSEQEKNYSLDPYLLKEYKNRWYIIAYRSDIDKVVTFALDRIKKLKVEKDAFLPIEHFNPDHYFKHCFGITHLGESPEKVELHFTPLQAKYILAQKIHPTQKVLKQDENGTTIQLNVLITFELVEQILSYGSNVKVISPASLKDRIKSELQKSLDQY